MNLTPFNPTQLDPATVTQRRSHIATLVLVLTLPAVFIMADLDHHTGFTLWKVLQLVLFTILFAQLAFGVAQAWTGFRLRRRGGDDLQILRTLDPDDTRVPDAPTAVIMPICNEEVGRVMDGVRAIYESMQSHGLVPTCDFFILSDSSNPNRWVEEEAAWLALVQKLDAHGHIFYRKRRGGINKKAGNVADFCRRWGSHYRYMVVLDADSIISGGAIRTMIRLMERNPQVGLIQAAPILVNGETAFARVQQFASRLYGTIFSAGLNFWQLGEGNYWGHNAIIRVDPFIRHCSLPELPGEGPFGGRILSHDYVEAALMRRAGWQVWLATGLAENYEECPANLIDFAKRDRRWLQGNLQHARLIAARGFHTVNRLHFTLGILSYVASPLWLLFLVLSCVIAAGPAAGWHGSGSSEAPALGLFLATVALLLFPKVLALLDLRRRPAEVAAFGGWGKLAVSIVAETLTYTFVPPVLMLFHTKFIALTLARQPVSWGAQRRGAAGESAWAEAVAGHAGQTLFGIIFALVVIHLSPALAWWMSPLLAGIILSIPISVLTGSPAVGRRLRQWKIFTTPEESNPGPELQRITEAVAARTPGREPAPELAEDYPLMQAVLDPYVNAVHVSMLRSKDYAPPAIERRLEELREKLLREGPASLSPRERLAVLADEASMVALHEEVWAAPRERLGPWWQLALRHYQVAAEPPRTALLAA